MTSIYELPSWDRSCLTEMQAAKYEVIAVGESFHTSRTTFQVICRDCGRVLHNKTNDPSYYIEAHDIGCPTK